MFRVSYQKYHPKPPQKLQVYFVTDWPYWLGIASQAPKILKFNLKPICQIAMKFSIFYFT